jgi:hypothetical protein
MMTDGQRNSRSFIVFRCVQVTTWAAREIDGPPLE